MHIENRDEAELLKRGPDNCSAVPGIRRIDGSVSQNDASAVQPRMENEVPKNCEDAPN